MFRYRPISMPAAIALCCSLLLAGTATPAMAQREASFACGNEPAGTRPMPRMIDFTLRTAMDGATDGPVREATVVGGHAVNGILRVEVRLDAVLPAGCVVPLSVVSGDVNSAAAAASPNAIRSLAEALDGLEFVNGQLRVDPVTASRQRAVADGASNVVRIELPIQGTNSRQPVRHALKLVMQQDYALGRSFAVTAQPLPRYFPNAPREVFTHGRNALLQIFHPAPLLPETARFPVRAVLSSAALGTWRTTAATVSQPSALEQELNWDPRFNPIRAEAALEPGNVSEPVTGHITYSWAGQDERVPVTINPSEGCRPVFSASAVPGGIRVSLSNALRGTCPVYTVIPRTPARAVLQLAPASAEIAVGAVTPAIAAPVAAPKLAGSSSLTGGRLAVQRVPSSAVFTINPLAFIQLAVGTAYTFEIRTKAGLVQTLPYVVSARDHAVITAR